MVAGVRMQLCQRSPGPDWPKSTSASPLVIKLTAPPEQVLISLSALGKPRLAERKVNFFGGGGEVVNFVVQIYCAREWMGGVKSCIMLIAIFIVIMIIIAPR